MLFQLFVKFKITATFTTGKYPKGFKFQLGVAILLLADLIVYVMDSAYPTHPLAHSLTHSPTRPLTRPLITPSLPHSLTHSSTHPLTHSPTHPPTHPLTHSCCAALPSSSSSSCRYLLQVYAVDDDNYVVQRRLEFWHVLYVELATKT